MKFSSETKQTALKRQASLCGSCGMKIYDLGARNRAYHEYGEIAHAHHIVPVKAGGTNLMNNRVIICQACHYLAHEGGNYRWGSVVGSASDFPYYEDSPQNL